MNAAPADTVPAAEPDGCAVSEPDELADPFGDEDKFTRLQREVQARIAKEEAEAEARLSQQGAAARARTEANKFADWDADEANDPLRGVQRELRETIRGLRFFQELAPDQKAKFGAALRAARVKHEQEKATRAEAEREKLERQRQPPRLRG